jgi:tight adherence protein C
MEPLLLTVAVFVALTGAIGSALHLLTAESTATRRVDALGAVHRTATTTAAPEAGLFKTLLVGLAPYGFGTGDSSLANTLTYAGLRSPNALRLFLGARTLITVGPALVVIVLAITDGKPLAPTLFRSLLMWLSLHTLVTRMLRRRAQRRIGLITRSLPDSLDLMVVCLEAGLGLNSTIARVGQERSSVDDPLGNEFAQVATEMRGGRSREDALRALGARNGSDDLKALAALIIQSDRLGASMAQTLRSHADLLRTKRRQRAEEEARKLPIKLLFPMALLILLPLFVIVAGPAAIIFKDFMRTMSTR